MSRKRRIQKPYVVFPGYVFVHVRYNWAIYYMMSRINGAIRLLGGGSEPEPLTDDEAELIVRNTELYKDPPVIRLNNDGYEILSEQFKEIPVRKINRHARRITFAVTILGKETEFTLSFIKAE